MVKASDTHLRLFYCKGVAMYIPLKSPLIIVKSHGDGR